jgi:hypothetical protein
MWAHEFQTETKCIAYKIGRKFSEELQSLLALSQKSLHFRSPTLRAELSLLSPRRALYNEEGQNKLIAVATAPRSSIRASQIIHNCCSSSIEWARRGTGSKDGEQGPVLDRLR